MSKEPSLSELVTMSTKRFCRPGFIKKRLHARGEPAIYLSKDKKFVVTEYPDGTIEKERLKRPIPLRSEQGRPAPKKRDDRPESGQGRSTSTKKRSKPVPSHPH